MMENEIIRLGLKDQPIEAIEQESLGLGEYADVLTEFIRHCETPLTIALQGDWGSGKTSLMTLIKNELAKENDRYHSAWFNTWQYAQFNMDNTLALSMMSKITDSLALDDRADIVSKVKQGLVAATKAVAVGGANFFGHGETLEKMANTYVDNIGAGNQDAASALEEIKSGLAQIVQARTSEKTEKVIVFIDDLDRLVPERAVELLEAMKIFLDIDHCVFVIACDYSVVTAGLKAKFGISAGELKGKSFFDKIIQVPFKMPTRRYEVDRYIESLLS